MLRLPFTSLAVVLLASAAALAQLAPPPGPVLPTDRTRINQRTIAAFPYTINQPGSYVLTSNVVGVPGLPVISVQVGDVTIDLGGFSIVGGTFGIELSPSIRDVTIINGVVAANSDTGINAQFASQVRLDGVRLNSNGGRGAYLGDAAVVSNCTAQTNALSGIRAGAGAVVSDCLSRENLGGVGIGALDRSVIKGCTAIGNGQTGIHARLSSTVENCTAHNNGSAAPGTWDGIFADQGSTIRACTGDNNTRWGIVLNARGNLLDSSTKDNANGGIVTGYGTTIQRCTAHDNGTLGRSTPAPVAALPSISGARKQTAQRVTLTAPSIEGEPAERTESPSRGTFIGDGISTGDGCVVVACDAQGNADAGIAVLDSSTITGCVVRFNQGGGIETFGSTTIRDCTATSGYGNGIDAGDGSTVEHCTAALNAGHGFTTTGNTVLRDCTADTNTGDGFNIQFSRNRIEGNQSVNNLLSGYNVTHVQNLITKNSASGNPFNYNIAPGNNFGSITFLFGGGPLFSNEPWANFEY